MKYMKYKEFIEIFAKIQEICKEIGCSEIDLYMCDTRPYNCKIIRELFIKKFGETECS